MPVFTDRLLLLIYLYTPTSLTWTISRSWTIQYFLVFYCRYYVMNNSHYGVFNEKKGAFILKVLLPFSQNIKTLFSKSLRCFPPPAAWVHIILNVCFIYGSLERFQRFGEKNSVWNGMWCCAEVFQSHRLCCWTSLTPNPPPIHLLSPRPFFLSLSHFLSLPPTWREPPFPLHHIHFPLAISPVKKKKNLNHAENLLFLIIARC